MNFRRIRALVVKERYQIVKDPSCILIAFVFPLLLLFIYGFGVSLDITNLKIGVCNQDTSYESISFIQDLQNSTFFKLTLAESEKELQYMMTIGLIKGYIIIPSYFGSFFKEKVRPAPIFIAADGSEPNTANFVQNYIKSAWQIWQSASNQELQITNSQPVSVQARAWYNEELNSRYFLIPGSIAIIMTLIGTLLTALVITREWERGTIEALMTTPMTMGEFLVAKVICYFTLGMGSMAFCTAVAVFFYGVPFQASLIALLAVSASFLLAAVSTGLLISTVANNQFVAAQMSSVSAFLPAFMLSGFIFDIDSMPYPIRLFTHIFPAKYMVQSLHTLFLAGNIWAIFISNILAMLLISSILLTVIAHKTKKVLRE